LIGAPFLEDSSRGGSSDSVAQFRYCGSIGPLTLPAPLERRMEEMGSALADAFGLRGLFGVDCVLRENEVWPVEVNPRWTASVEVLERACGLQAARLHVEAFGFAAISLPQNPRSSGRDPAGSAGPCAGKAIIYAPGDATISPEFVGWAEQQNRARQWPAVADIPTSRITIRTGHPLVTVLADGPNEPAVVAVLQRLASQAEAILFADVAAANNCHRHVSCSERPSVDKVGGRLEERSELQPPPRVR
jgi:uncharacterized protein